ncbi:MAG TPA: DUF4124 domain-containing protein [Sedimenticola thiotaurini]|uniref:DUF4124 domain-containing protein n=1 Tax=Sedimenticola thiotaurini TaxID=1543721 RepID=A0A831RND6_9GAMM|nr:DUF4124 domain-containing protein [Sedimenticola thiotaurini]
MSPKVLVSTICCLCLGGPSPASAAAPVHRCVDATGQVAFSQFPCPPGQGGPVRIRPPGRGWLPLPAPGPRAGEDAVATDTAVPAEVERDGRRGEGSGCWKARRRLERIARRLRQGYRRAEGERLRRRRDDDEAYLARFCRDA